jgi:iron complex outermembrane receptor protein
MLGSERSLGLEASLRRRQGFVTGAMTVFAHRFHGYIFERFTGEMAVEGDDGWQFVSTDEAADGEESALRVFNYVQSDARFWGAELETIWHLHESTKWNLDLRLAADFTRAQEGGRNLPRIPAARTTGGVSWSSGNWSASAECQVVMDQDRVAAHESVSDGYALVSAHVSRTFDLGHSQLEIFLRGSNLADAEARSHTSFVKDLAPLGGRAFTAGARITF